MSAALLRSPLTQWVPPAAIPLLVLAVKAAAEAKAFGLLKSSRPRELPPQSLTESDMSLSVHPGLIDQPFVAPVASAQIDEASVLRYVQASKRLCVCASVTFCTSAWPIVAMRR